MRSKTFNDPARYQFIQKFGFHACYRVRATGELVLHCYSNNNECTVSVNKAAQAAFIGHEPATPHFFHLETNARSQRVAPDQLSSAFDGPDYSVIDLDILGTAAGVTLATSDAAF